VAVGGTHPVPCRSVVVRHVMTGGGCSHYRWGWLVRSRREWRRWQWVVLTRCRVIRWELDSEHGSVYDLVCINLVVMQQMVGGCLPGAVSFVSHSAWVRGGGSGGGGRLYSPGTMSLGGGSTASRYEHVTPGPLGLLMSSSSCLTRAVGGRGCLPCAASTSPAARLCFPVSLPSTPTR
jgi:hypothetical protein